MKFRSVKNPNPIHRSKKVSNKQYGFYWRCECGTEGRPYSPSTRKEARDDYWLHRKRHHGGLGD